MKPLFSFLMITLFSVLTTTACSSPAGNSTAAAQPIQETPAALKGVPVKARPGYYPNSNESGQMRMDVDLDQGSVLALDIDPNKKPMPVAFRYMGPVKGLQIQAEGLPAVGDLDGLIAYLTRNAKNDREKAEALYYFVINDMKDWYYPAQGINLTVEDLSTLIWNFGFGFCYDLGRLQAGLWARAGLRSRIVGWPQHTVAEVFYDNAWHLYDLQHRSFYEKEDGSVASFDELKANPKLFYQGLNEYGLDAISYPPHHMAHWYGIASPNFQDSAEKDHWRVEKSFKMDLRLGEMFEVLYTEPVKIYHPDSWAQYYGEMTLRKDPPWPVHGRLVYAPAQIKQLPKWENVTTANGKPGFAITMSNPYIFSEGWINVPGLPGFWRLWVKAHGQTYFVGRMVGGKAIFSRFIEGGNQFTVIVQPEKEGAANDLGLDKVEIHTRMQLSHLGLPKLRPGANRLPIPFESGRPHLSWWYLESAPDLALTDFRVEPKNPKPGQDAYLVYTVTNNGSKRNKPTSLTVYNNVTAFMSETIEKVGVSTLPPIGPGKSIEHRVYWQANKRMTWYGKNPYVQLFDAWLDIDKDRAEYSRDNDRRQDYVLLSTEEGGLPELPGYAELPGGH